MSITTDTVFVRGIPHDTTDEQLMAKFSDVGPVKHAYCLRDQTTQRAAYGFIKFAIREDAQVAVDTLNGAFLNGKKIQVENAIERGAAHKKDIALAKKNRKQQEGIDKQEWKDRRLRTVVLWAPPRETNEKTVSTQINSGKNEGEYMEESADEDDNADHHNIGNGSGSNSSDEGSSSDNDDSDSDSDSDSEEEEEEITNEDLVLALLAKHAFTNAEVRSGQRLYGDRAFLATFADAKKARNAYRRLKKVATAFYPKREFNISLKTKAAESCRLIVRNLAWKATESEILNIFQRFGPVRSIHFPHKEEKSRGFCFVQYWTRDDALRAVSGANEMTVRDREIAVDMVASENISTPSLSSSSSSLSASSSSSSNVGGKSGEGDEGDEGDEGGEGGEGDEGDEGENDKDNKGDKGEDEEKQKRNTTGQLTLFVRNLPYDTEEDDLYQTFRAIGPVHYAKIVRDRLTNRSMGTAFVKFRDQSSVKIALSRQPPLTIASRELNIVRAVSREHAKEIADVSAEERSNKRKKEDRRHLYLAREGKLTADMESQIPKADTIKRQNADREKQQKLTNPNFFVSPTRLSVRNIARRLIKIPADMSIPGDKSKDPFEPRMIDNKLLKAIFLDAAKKGMRENLVREDEGDQALMPQTKSAWRHIKIVQAKVIADDTSLTSSEVNAASRGYGFVQFTEHAHALAALRMLNNNPNFFWCAPGPKASNTPHFRRSRLIVEFAVEDAKKIAKRDNKIKHQPVGLKAAPSSTNSMISKRKATDQSTAKTLSKNKKRKKDKNHVVSKDIKSGGTLQSEKKSLEREDSGAHSKLKKKKTRSKKKLSIASASTSELVSSMKANAKRWFE